LPNLFSIILSCQNDLIGTLWEHFIALLDENIYGNFGFIIFICLSKAYKRKINE